MSKNKKKNINRNDVPVSSLLMKPSYASFVMHCFNNDKCFQIMLNYAPKIGATGCLTTDQFLFMLGGYGSMVEEDYNCNKAEMQEAGLDEFAQLFFSLVDELREILKPLYKNAPVVVSEGPGFVVFE